MNHFEQICQAIRTLIQQIFKARQQLQEISELDTQESRKASQTFVRLFGELLKEVASIQVEEGFSKITSISGRELQWNSEYGIAIKSSDELKPFLEWGDNFPVGSIDLLADSVKAQLDITLRKINDRKTEKNNHILKVNNVINVLEKWEKQISKK
ncbi:MAG: hypothetical protein ACO37W_10895 [Prochlorotrichaceae cyanobacterium]